MAQSRKREGVVTAYDGSGPKVTIHNDTTYITHNHGAKYDSNSRGLDDVYCHLKGCIAFFKTQAEHSKDLDLVAAANGAVAEDEARLEMIKGYRSHK